MVPFKDNVALAGTSLSSKLIHSIEQCACNLLNLSVLAHSMLSLRRLYSMLNDYQAASILDSNMDIE